MKEEPRTAERFVRIAKFASPRDEAEYGTAKLDAALQGYVGIVLQEVPDAYPSYGGSSQNTSRGPRPTRRPRARAKASTASHRSGWCSRM
ncbi:hypothetical protein BH09MYX1_BH09MYX1_50580 [soil metagenome]